MYPVAAISTETSLESLTAVVERIIRETEQGAVSVNDLLRSFGQTSFAPLLIIPALVLITPLSGIPGMSTFCGVVIMLIAGQRLVGHEQIWLPGWIRKRSIMSEKLNNGMCRLLPFTRFVDRYSQKRLTFLFKRPLSFILPLVCVMAAAVTPLMEIIPFSSSIAGVAIALIACAILTRDGLFALLALLPIGGVLWGIYTVMTAV